MTSVKNLFSQASVLFRIHDSNRPLLLTILCGYTFVQWFLTIVSMILLAVLKPIGAPTVSVAYIFAQLSNATIGFGPKDGTDGLFIALFLCCVLGIVAFWYMQKGALFIYGAFIVALAIFINHSITSWSASLIYSIIMIFLYPIIFFTAGVVSFNKLK